VFSPSLASMVIGEFRRMARLDPAEPVLTARENEILGLVAKGYRYSEIARKLFIAEKTTQNHVQNNPVEAPDAHPVRAHALRDPARGSTARAD